jgi:hypothetical protein
VTAVFRLVGLLGLSLVTDLDTGAREITRRLVISPRTAERHVQDIYLKIGASTRAAAVLFAMEHGLLDKPG